MPQLKLLTDTGAAEIPELVHRRKYPTRPPATLGADFRRHVNATGRPETYPTISTTKPPADTRVVVISEIHVSKAVRGDETCAPCPICNSHGSQFLHGLLIWCETSQAIYAIGMECGDTLFQAGLLDRAVADYKQQQREVSLDRVLLDALPRIRLLAAWADQYEQAAADADRLTRSFRRQLTGQISGLESAARSGGYLSGLDKDGQPAVLGKIGGAAFCLGTSQCVRDHRIARQYLAAVDFGTDDEVLDRLQAMSFKEKTTASTLAARARGLLLKVAERLTDCWEFTRPENLVLLNQWGGQQRDRMSALGDGQKVRIDVNGKHWFDRLVEVVRPGPVPALRDEPNGLPGSTSA